MEEKIVNGVLCYPIHSCLKGGETEWVSYTLESLTTAFRAMRSMYESADQRAIELESIIKSIRKNTDDYFGERF